MQISEALVDQVDDIYPVGTVSATVSKEKKIRGLDS